MDETQGKREMGDRDKERQRNGNRETEKVREKDGGETGKKQTQRRRDRETVGKTGGGERFGGIGPTLLHLACGPLPTHNQAGVPLA